MTAASTPATNPHAPASSTEPTAMVVLYIRCAAASTAVPAGPRPPPAVPTRPEADPERPARKVDRDVHPRAALLQHANRRHGPWGCVAGRHERRTAAVGAEH